MHAARFVAAICDQRDFGVRAGPQDARVQQASLSLERDLPGGFTGTLSYLLVHGADVIRARDVNLPPPTYYSYPILNSAGNSVPNQFYDVWSFATWQTSYSISCPYPPCINTL